MSPEQEPNNAEILRLRERAHRQAATIQAMSYRIESLERFRKEYGRKVDDLVSDAQIEDAVRSALRAQRHNMFSIPQRIAGAIIGVAAVVSVVLQVLHG